MRSDVVTNDETSTPAISDETVNEHDSLKYHLLGPSLTKAGQSSVDQQKVDPSLSVQCTNL